MKNRIYFYSGTGNSYRMAEKLKEKLAECELAAITNHTELEIPSGYERIGFVLPAYFQGIPKILADYVVMYDMSKKVEEITERTEKEAESVIAGI